MAKFILTVIKEIEADDLHEAVQKISDDPMEYVMFDKVGVKYGILVEDNDKTQ